MQLCLCDICTRGGRQQQGSKQSITTIREHKRAQESRDRLAHAVATDLGRHSRIEVSDTTLSRDINFTLLRVQARIVSFRLPSRIVFLNPPSTPHSLYVADGHASSWLHGRFALDAVAGVNSGILHHIRFLHETYNDFSQTSQTTSTLGRISPGSWPELSRVLSSELSRMETFREQAWNEQLSSLALSSRQSDLSREPISYTPRPILGDHTKSGLIQFTIAFLVVVLNLVFKLSFRGCRFVLQVTKTIVQLAHSEFLKHPHSTTLDTILQAIPSDLLTARKFLSLDPESTDYACCPACFALYPPGEYHSPPIPIQVLEDAQLHRFDSDPLPPYVAEPSRFPDTLRYPKECTFKETSESQVCGTSLLRLGFGQTPRPIRIYSYQRFIPWLGRLLCRADIEPHLDISQASAMSPHDGPVDDILSSQEVRHFPGPDELPFLRICGSEGRYLFSLFVDWFHPRGNRQGGAAYSAGVILMVCLNLPPTLRYKRENIYLAGIIPGPKAPSLQEVNHLVEPLILEFRELWFKGAHFSRTALRREGRLARCAIVPLICDLGAGRKVSGNASHSSTFFCSFCQLQKCDINNVDRTSWPRRDCQHFRVLAEQWRAASNANEREALFKRSGVRYSPLLLLPYWRPTRHVIIDTMHNLFLGLFQRHCRRIFGMTMKVASHDGGDVDEPGPVAPEELKVARLAALRCTTAASLRNKFNLRILRSIYTDLGLGFPGTKTKMELSEEILTCRTGATEGQIQTASHHPPKTASESRRRLRNRAVVLGRDLLALVRADMAATVYPTFLSRAPPDAGSASAGTLSAEQWRTFCMINLIITLVRIWGHLPESDRRTKLLTNFADLVAAVRAGTAKRLSDTKINSYEVRILDYVRGLRALFPDISLVPNDHLALHLGEVLRAFGPTHSYWAFPFERCIRILRDVNTNFHPSAMERTFFASFCRTTNLLVALRDPALPSILRPFTSIIDDTATNEAIPYCSPQPASGACLEPISPLPPTVYGALLHRLLAEPHLSNYTFYRSVQSPTDTTTAVLNQDAQILPAVTHLGRRFSDVRHSIGDSNIMFSSDRSGGSMNEAIGQIQFIFKHERSIGGGEFRQDIFLAVKAYPPLSPADAHLDPYRAFWGLGAILVQTTLGTEIIVIPLRDVICHVAICPFKSIAPGQMLPYPCSVVVVLDESWNK